SKTPPYTYLRTELSTNHTIVSTILSLYQPLSTEKEEVKIEN
ncbi:hypothetical protein WYG_3577, partial [Citrobacter sp. A1]